MTKSLIAKSLTILVLAGALLAGCASEPVHSSYFIVAFVPGTPTPSQEGVEALGYAVGQATRDTPRFIAIDGSEPADATGPDLEKQRAAAIFAAFAQAGVDGRIIRVDLHPAIGTSYSERKDGFVVQLGYGEAPPS
jgi:hypothetical protein